MASGLFSSIQSLSTKLLDAIRGNPSTSHQQDQDPVESVRDDLKKLTRMLVRIQAVQQDAEEREIHDRSVRLWLEELRGVAYQAEDVLDEFYYELLRSIVESGDAAIEAYHRNGGTKRKFAEIYASSSLASYSFTITKASIPEGMVEKIKGITERFQEISNARRDLHLREEDGTRLVSGPQIRPPTSSHLDERAIFGREEEKEEIISLLNLSNGPDIMVLPIVGMGGVGKTTLAQLVYNDSRIRWLFNKRCWVSVSEDFDLVRLTKAIVDSVSDNPFQSCELSILQDVLKEKMRGLSLFLVLDDVWNEKRNIWECFRVGFFGAKFVRILMTTRNTSVAKIMQTTSPFQLGSLPEENCWSLFKHFAFGNSEASENGNLHKIGRGIVQKCKGSPLAIKALGGLLCYEMDEEKWREILESDISEIDETGEIMPALWLSYQKLPQHLKPCFLYLSMFPKDTPFEKDMVVRLWMAQGYINGNTRKMKTLEEIGSEYFDELQGRSLVDCESFTGYFLHDLVYDLARSISQEAYRPILENDHECNGPCKVNHLYLTNQDKLLGSCLARSDYCSIRTFVKECPRSWNFDFAISSEFVGARALHLRHSLLPNTLGTLKHLRYLSVGNTHMETLPETLCLLYNLQTLDFNSFYLRELPENIKNLVNLRYFQLSSGEIQQLPESMFMLRNLHTLSLEYCTKLKELPRGIEQLTRLRILNLPLSLINMPSGIGKLTTIKPLSGHFSVMDHGMIGGLGELKDMNKLSGLLCISGLRNISNVEYSRNANLASKPNLHKLILNFDEGHSILGCRDKELHLVVCSSKNTKNENNEKIQDVVLTSLKPHGNLIELAILNYGGRIFPSWLLNPLLPKLTTLTLNFWTEPNFLPPFGQLPHLMFLDISGNIGVRNVRDELITYSLLTEYGSSKQPKEPSYPSLEVLSLRNMLNVVEWQAHDCDFPRLKKLVIDNCPKLRTIATIPLEVRDVLVTECSCHELQFSLDSKVQNVLISNCPDLISVHSMGKGLLALVNISVQGCPRLCKFTNIHKLPALKSISLHCCPELWIFPTIPEEIKMLNIQKCGFREIMLPSRSENLIISNCLELISISWRDKGLNSIAEVTFEHCPKLEFLTFPAGIRKLMIHKCGFREIMFPLISQKLNISHCPELILIYWKDISLSVREVTFEYCPKLKLLACPSVIKKLKIHECGFREIMFWSVSKNLTISNCVELASINWRDGGLIYVREINFEYCPKLELVTIPVGTLKLKIHECGFRTIMFYGVSEHLTISNCAELILINWIDWGLNSVEEVSFECCPKLELITIPVRTLKLKIHECGFRSIMFRSVSVNITISNCIELISINWSDGGLNSIEEVSFEHCPKFNLPTIPTAIKKLKIAYSNIKEIIFPLQSKIQMLHVFHCPLLTSIHWVKRETLFHTNLLLEDCPKLQKGLKNMRISYCPILQFPVNNVLHSMIERAEIYDCPRMDLGKRYIYQRDTTSKVLNLLGNNEICLSSVNSPIPLLKNPLALFLTKEDFLEMESLTCVPVVGLSCQHIMLNQPSLVIMEILRCRKVISVTGLDNLRNLKRLSISYCPEFCNWNDKTLPLSLKFLELNCCDKLSSLPLLSVQNHSSTLKNLVIMNCPRLAVLEGFHGLLKLENLELLHCRNISICLATERLQFRPHITIGDCPLMRDWCQRNNITYYED
ncbi:putative disease resistance RPP13-like protein 1 [Carex rostrata]